MKLPILSVKDNLIGFGSPFTSTNEAVAVRGFTNSIIKSLECGTDDSVSPEDLALYRIGDFDTESGVISPCEPSALARGHVIVTQHKSNSCNCANISGGDSLDD